MCGICGFYDLRKNSSLEPRDLLEAMTQRLLHRGPDGHGIWLDETQQIGLGQTRLAIIDLISGQQPMVSASGQYVIVFNGEIYNYRALRGELEQRGHHFATQSDTEVIVEAYAEWGRDALTRLHGMFAFALLDVVDRRLCLARDPVGIKPLYYLPSSRGLFFGSEIKSILQDDLPHRINYEALADFFILGYPLWPKTAFADVCELEPGSWLEIDATGITHGRYWTWKREEQDCAEATALDEAEAVLTESLQEHLVADVPIGAFLSGGIDSSLLVALLVKSLGVKVDTFNVRFGEADYDESSYARLVANHLGVQHHEIQLGNGQPDIDLVDRVLEQFDQPFGDSSAIPTYLISQRIRQHVKVVLGGDGGDEMFGGYPRFRYADMAQRLGHWPRPVVSLMDLAGRWGRAYRPDFYRQSRRLLGAAGRHGAERLLRLACSNYPEQLADILLPAARAKVGSYYPVMNSPGGTVDTGGPDLIDATVNFALPGDYLRKIDVMSGAHGLEVRVPFLGAQVLAYAERLPHPLRYRGGTGKILLRQLTRRYLPDVIAHKPKAGFGIPLDSWLGAEGRKSLGHALTSPGAGIRDLLQPAWIDSLVEAFVSGRWDRTERSRFMLYQNVYFLWSLERWLQQWQPAF